MRYKHLLQPLYIILLLIFPVTTICAAQASLSSPLLLQERYLLASFTATYNDKESSNDIQSDMISFDLDFSAFNGDFPLILNASRDEVTIYSGSPYYFPLFFSVGTTNQGGYFDPYRTHTVLALLSIGYRTNLLAVEAFPFQGAFAVWGWRFGAFSGGFSYYYEHHLIQTTIGASFQNGSVSLTASNNQFEVSFLLRTQNSWSVGASLHFDTHNAVKLSLKAGISRRDYPADSLYEDDWDMLIAHRGSLEHAPENSITAFNWALDQPQYIGIETDIRQTADGNFVLVHDATLLRYQHGFTAIEDLTTAEIKSLDMGSWFDPRFSGQRVIDLIDLAQVANENPDTYWLLEIKDTDWTEEDVYRFLSIIENTFHFPEKIVIYVVSHQMLPLFKQITGRPVGLQLDTVKNMLFLSDHLLPLVDEEMQGHLQHADFFTILSSKYDRSQEIKELAEYFDIPVMYWNFHDTIFGYIPKARKQFPLGMSTIEHGPVIKEAYRRVDYR